MVTLTIDGKEVSVPEHTTILNAAYQAGSMIPTLCYLKDLNCIGSCRKALTSSFPPATTKLPRAWW